MYAEPIKARVVEITIIRMDTKLNDVKDTRIWFLRIIAINTVNSIIGYNTLPELETSVTALPYCRRCTAQVGLQKDHFPSIGPVTQTMYGCIFKRALRGILT